MAVVGRPHISATGVALAAPFASGSRLPDQSEIRRLLLQMIPGGENYCRRILRRFVVYFNRRVNALLLCPGCRRIMAIHRISRQVLLYEGLFLFSSLLVKKSSIP